MLAEPERGHGERGALASGGRVGRGGFSDGKFCRNGASWSNLMKTRRVGKSPLKCGAIVFLVRA
jgi:hypothetical protein